MKQLLKFSSLLIFVMLFQSCTLFSAAGLSSHGQPVKEVKGSLTSTTANSAVNLDHSEWSKLLKKLVTKDGMVDYQGFLQHRDKLNSYLQYLSSNEPTEKWSLQELLAYYINLYNAYTVDLILDHYPLKSIKDIDGAWTKGIVPVGNRELSLGGIENGILRKMNEPRIHFAINCASQSCPKLLNEAYTAARINEQLDQVTREFINSDKNSISKDAASLSMIFKWYAEDFTVNGKEDVKAYVNQYSQVKIAPGVKLNYLEYDWGLNEK